MTSCDQGAESLQAVETTPQERARNDEKGIPAKRAAQYEACPVTIEKKRKADAKGSCCSTEDANLNGKGLKSRHIEQTSDCNIREMRTEVTTIHANSQRILRETKKASFAAEVTVQKPLSSIIEKIRQRRIQLAPKVAKLQVHFNSPNENSMVLGSEDPGSVVNSSVSNTEQSDQIGTAVENDTFDACGTTDNLVDGSLEALSLPEGPEDDSVVCSSVQAQKDNACQGPLHQALRVPPVESMGGRPDSQTRSSSRSKVPMSRGADVLSMERTRSRVHLFTGSQDDSFDRILKCKGKRREESSASPDEELWSSIGHVRQLVDDEAEDEDEDEDLVNDEDDSSDRSDDLGDLLGEDIRESKVDKEQRLKLHSKWLEQQDLAFEDSILNRLEKGFKSKSREPPAVDEKQRDPAAREAMPKSRNSCQLLSGGSSKSIASTEEANIVDMQGAEAGGSQSESGRFEHADLEASSSDDEEAEGKLRRQLILEESEEQTEFLSVSDDESSKDIFTRINKVNVTAVKTRSTTVHLDGRTAGTSHPHRSLLQHQSSFLKRKVTTAVTTRHGSGVSKSYVFGRDDSNSSDSNRINEQTKKMLQAEKEDSFPLARTNVTSATYGARERPPNGGKDSTQNRENPYTPSLFQILKQQAAHLESSGEIASLKCSRTTANDLASFLAVRPLKRATSSRGQYIRDSNAL